VQLIRRVHLADLGIVGSHCVGLDVLIGRLQSEGISVNALNVGSTAGLAAAKRGECDDDGTQRPPSNFDRSAADRRQHADLARSHHLVLAAHVRSLPAKPMNCPAAAARRTSIPCGRHHPVSRCARP